MQYLRTVLFLILLSFCNLSGQSKPYTILISLDGFRWDYLERNITPNLHNISTNGVRALSLRPTFPSKTFPNHYSVISGMHAQNHGIIANYFDNPFTKEIYKVGDTLSVRNSKWYLGEAFWETAKRNNILTASYFWPGSEVNNKNRRPNHFEYYEHNRDYDQRVDDILEWLKLPISNRPRFITLYFDATDTYGHKFGPDSEECNDAINRLDSLIGKLMHGIQKLDLRDSTNIIVVSDHGMTNISSERTINIEKMLSEYKIEYEGSGPLMSIRAESDEIESIYRKLKSNENHFKVYRKANIPDYFHYDRHPFIDPLILVADLGWSLVDNRKAEQFAKGKYSKGNHGYEKDLLDMHGIFVAKGPTFRSGYKTGTLWNIDIYPLLCKIYNIKPRSNIDGKSERIEFILKGK